MITAYVMKELTDSSAYPFSYGNSTWFLNKKHASKIFSYHMKGSPLFSNSRHICFYLKQ